MIVGSMITYNEYHFLPYSFPIFYSLCDKIVILDKSNDIYTRSYFDQFDKDKVTVYHEEDFEPMTYKGRRQFLLDKCRELYGLGNCIVSIDADEIISLELFCELCDIAKYVDDEFLVNTEWTQICNDIDHEAYIRCYPRPRQSVMIKDNGRDFGGFDMVHEDKLPYYDNVIKIDAPLVHLGMCNLNYIRSKARMYILLHYLEGKNSIPMLNLLYFRKCKIIPVRSYFDIGELPKEVFDTSDLDAKRRDSIIKLVVTHKDRLNEFYAIDMWDDPKLVKMISIVIPEFDKSKIKYKCRNEFVLWFRFTVERIIDMAKSGDLKYIPTYCMKVVRSFVVR